MTFYKDLKKVAEHIKTRSIAQVRSHLQKHQLKEKRKLEKISVKDKEKIKGLESDFLIAD